MSVTTSSALIRYEDELKRRLQKLSRTYDLTTMKIFIVVECLGDARVCSTYNPEKRNKLDTFLLRKEACRLDVQKHEKNRQNYMEFLSRLGLGKGDVINLLIIVHKMNLQSFCYKLW